MHLRPHHQRLDEEAIAAVGQAGGALLGRNMRHHQRRAALRLQHALGRLDLRRRGVGRGGREWSGGDSSAAGGAPG